MLFTLMPVLFIFIVFIPLPSPNLYCFLSLPSHLLQVKFTSKLRPQNGVDSVRFILLMEDLVISTYNSPLLSIAGISLP